MEISKQKYSKMVKQSSPSSPIVKDSVKAFFVGGGICTLGQALQELYLTALPEESAKLLASITLIFIAAVLTALGIFDKLAKHAGAGTLVPITGFANAVVSPAIEYKAEGFVMGVGAKMFTIAGPVIVYGTVASVVYGVIYWITTLF